MTTTTPQVKHTFDRPTDKQVAYAESLARKAGYRFLDDAEKACFGRRRIQGMNRQNMSDLIDWLKEQI